MVRESIFPQPIAQSSALCEAFEREMRDCSFCSVTRITFGLTFQPTAASAIISAALSVTPLWSLAVYVSSLPDCFSRNAWMPSTDSDRASR